MNAQTKICFIFEIWIILIASSFSDNATCANEGERRAKQAELFSNSDEQQAARRARHAELFSKSAEDVRREKIRSDLDESLKRHFNPVVESIVNDKRPWKVFIVPGTYGNSAAWFHCYPEKVSFASELQREIGPSSEIIPFIWLSSIEHEMRQKAADRLAKEISEQCTPEHRVAVIAHSHGGNVAMLAASKLSQKIDILVCMATPCIYLRMKNAGDNTICDFPIYCSPDGRKNIETIFVVWAANDAVVNKFAGMKPGIDVNDALDLTTAWQRKNRGYSLLKDRELKKEIFEGKSDDSTNLVVSPTLNVGDINLSLYSESSTKSLDSIESVHSAIHSRRMGAILGKFIRNPTAENLEYIATFQQPADSDVGEPISKSEYDRWTHKNKDLFNRVGLNISEVVLEEYPRKGVIPNRLELRVDGNAVWTGSFDPASSAPLLWRPRCSLKPNDAATFSLYSLSKSGTRTNVAESSVLDAKEPSVIEAKDRIMTLKITIKSIHR